MVNGGKDVLALLGSAKVTKKVAIDNKNTQISARVGERKSGDEEGNGDEDGEDEDEDEDEDDEDDDDDDDDPEAIRKEMQEGLDHNTVRQVQPSEEDHEKLVNDLRNMPKNLPGAARVKLVQDCYRGKWWTGDRMMDYFKLIPDDVSRVAVLVGPGVMYKRCVDPDSGGLDQLLEMISDKNLQSKTRATIEEFMETSKSRGAVHGAVHHEDQPESPDKEKRDEKEGPESAASKAADGKEGEPIQEATEEGEQGGAEEGKAEEAEEKPKVVKKEKPHR